MCGISGQFTHEASAYDPVLWDRMVKMMQRRGPDDRYIYHDSQCVLATCRLKIMDLSDAGRLPISSRENDCLLAFNGEIYNYRELRRELESKGHQFRSSGDAEVVLYALQEWGPACLGRFNGMFSLAFYDRSRRALLLARDHAAMKPLYILWGSGGAAFASEFDQIMAHPWARDRSPDREAVEMYLRLGYIPAPRAFLKGTEMLLPGTWVEIRADRHVERGKFFEFAQEGHDENAPDDEEISDTLARAVARHRVSDAKVGCFLSGGIDSPLIASYLDRADATKTFSIGMDDPELDEGGDASRYSSALGTRQHVELLAETDLVDMLNDVVAATKEPLADEGMFPSLMLARLARQHVKVALSGDGGDELFWGYFPRQSDALARVERGERITGHDYLRHFTKLERGRFEQLFPTVDWWPDGEPGFDFDLPRGDASGRILRECEFRNYLPLILLKTDRASMHYGLEVRLPFLDREVIALAKKFRAAECIDVAGAAGKLPLRRALQRRVGFTTPGKRGFCVPFRHWLPPSFRPQLAESLGRLRGLESIPVDRNALAALQREHFQTGNHGFALWRLLILDLWVGKHQASRVAGSN